MSLHHGSNIPERTREASKCSSRVTMESYRLILDAIHCPDAGKSLTERCCTVTPNRFLIARDNLACE